MARNTSIGLGEHFEGFIANQLESGRSDYSHETFIAELDDQHK